MVLASMAAHRGLVAVQHMSSRRLLPASSMLAHVCECPWSRCAAICHGHAPNSNSNPNSPPCSCSGVVLLHQEPPEARRPTQRWRLYVFKGDKPLDDPLHIHRCAANGTCAVTHMPAPLVHLMTVMSTTPLLQLLNLPVWTGAEGGGHPYRPPLLQQAACCAAVQVGASLVWCAIERVCRPRYVACMRRSGAEHQDAAKRVALGSSCCCW